MKKLYLPVAFAGALLLSLSCSNKGNNEEHAHEHETVESHNHEGHNHEEEGHEGHDHEHEGHNHEAEETHNHEGEDGHAHEGEAAKASDEIVLSPEKAKASGVVVTEIQPTTFRQVIRTSGEVLAAQGDEATVVAATSGVVSFPSTITEGKSVAKGSNLVVISAKNMLEGEPAERARIAYEAAKDEYERALKLTDSGIVSKKDFTIIKENYENARISYEALAGQAGENGQRVQAPIGGYIKNCLVKSGDYVTAGQPLLTVTRNRRLFLRAEVSERYYKYLHTIKSANFKTPYDDRVYSLDELNGKVLSYGKSTDNTMYYLPVTFEFDNKGEVIPGSFVEIYLLSQELQNVLTLPKTALTEEQGLFFVYIQLDAECYKKQEVKVGADNGREVQILSGIKAGDKVVTEGAYHVKLASASNAIPAHSHEH